MTTLPQLPAKPWLDIPTGIFSLLIAVASFNLYTIWHIKADADLLSICGLFWGTVIYLLWERRTILVLESDLPATVLGMVILGSILLKGTAYYTIPNQFAPLLSLFAVALIASGFRGLKQYKIELLIMFIFISSTIFQTLIFPYLNYLSLATASMGNLILVYSGFETVRQGTIIQLPTGTIDVYWGCSGIEAMLQTLRLSALFLLLFPVGRIQAVFVPPVAIVIAFVVNAIRVALMALLVAGGDKLAFDYWHEGTGSNIFSLVTMMLFGLFCKFMIQSEPPEPPESAETP